MKLAGEAGIPWSPEVAKFAAYVAEECGRMAVVRDHRCGLKMSGHEGRLLAEDIHEVFGCDAYFTDQDRAVSMYDKDGRLIDWGE